MLRKLRNAWKALGSWAPPRGSVLFKAYLFGILAVVFLIILLGVEDFKVSSPLLALVSANLLAVNAIPYVGEKPKWSTTLDMFIILLSASSGMLAAWYWLQSVEGVSPFWSGLGALLVLVFIGIVWAIWYVRKEV